MDERVNCCVGSLPTILQIVKLNMILSAEHLADSNAVFRIGDA